MTSVLGIFEYLKRQHQRNLSSFLVSRAPRNVNPEVFYVLFVESLQMMHTVTLRFMCT